jgi:penicillin amidase
MQNVVMADSDGKIALQLAGVAPRRQKNQGMMGVAPVFGWESKNDWKEYLKPNALPNQLGSDKTLLITANQKIEDKDSEFALTGDWTLPFRYQRIEELLKVSKQHDMTSTQKIQSDTVSKASLALLPVLNATQSKHPLAKEAKELLAQFNGDMRMDSAAALIYNAWVDQYTRAIFTPWLEDSFTEIYSKRSLLDGLIHITSNELNYWCDHPKTTQVENCNQLRSLALDTALSYLSKRYGNQINKWQWGQAHPAIGAHKPLSRIPIIKFWFEISAPSPGDMHTVNVGRMNFNDPKEPYASTLAPGMRAIYDLSNLNESVFIGFGGQSGWIQSGRYQNYMDAWQKNQYLPLSITPKGAIQGELILKNK